MNKKITIGLIISLLVVINVNASTTSNKVAVLYNQKTQINRNTLHFMGSEFKSLAEEYDFQTFENGGSIKPGEYKAIIILNTGVETGVDPVLNSFINKWDNKSELIVLNLYKGSTDFSVKKESLEVGSSNIDAVSSASIWRKPLFSSISVSNSDIKNMHNNWIQEIVNILDSKN